MRQAVTDMGAQSIVNQAAYPYAFLPAGKNWGFLGRYSHTFSTVVASGLPGGCPQFARMTITSGDGTTAGGRGFGISNANPEAVGSYTTPGLIANPGQPHTVSLWMRSSQGDKLAVIRLVWVDAAGTLLLDARLNGGTGIALPANKWTKLSLTSTPPDGAVGAAAYATFAGGLLTLGETLDGTALMVAEGTGQDYADGNTPGWKWLGAVGASKSVGWPYTLESIAGAPVASITGVGSVALTTAQVPALSGRTIYVVTDRLALPGTGVAARFARGVLAQGGADLRSDGPSARYTYRPQYDGAGGGAGGAYSTGYIATVPAAGTRNVHCVAEMDGLTSYEHEVNGGAPVVKTGMVPGSGHTAPGLYTELGLDGTTTVESPVYAVQFVGGHSYETRKRVTAWLGRRHGSPVPAGY